MMSGPRTSTCGCQLSFKLISLETSLYYLISIIYIQVCTTPLFIFYMVLTLIIEKHHPMYGTLAKVFEKFVPMFEKVLTELQNPRPHRLGTHRDYWYPVCYFHSFFIFSF
jgi:hypothetical protein